MNGYVKRVFTAQEKESLFDILGLVLDFYEKPKSEQFHHVVNNHFWIFSKKEVVADIPEKIKDYFRPSVVGDNYYRMCLSYRGEGLIELTSLLAVNDEVFLDADLSKFVWWFFTRGEAK